jgi:hypothetical protein
MDDAVIVLAATSSRVPWTTVAAGLATLRGRTAAVHLTSGRTLHAGDPLRRAASTFLELRASTDQPVPAGRVAAHVRRLSETHDLVLICGGNGLMVPPAPGSATLPDVAATVGAPILLVAQDTPDDASHAALAASAARVLRIPLLLAAVGPGHSLERAVARPVARIPHRPPLEPARIRACAAQWFDPSLAGESPTAPQARFVPDGSPPATLHLRTIVAIVVVLLVAFCAIGDYCGLDPFGTDPPDATDSDVSTVDLDASLGDSFPHEPRACSGYTGGIAGPDAATVRAVDASWTRIENWLHAHAPQTFAALGAPASMTAVYVLSNQGITLPADMTASLLRHNGVGASAGDLIPPDYDILNLERMAAERARFCDIAHGLWRPDFVPVAVGADDTCLLVGMAQAPGGATLGTFGSEGSPSFARRGGSWLTLLQDVATALETGTYRDLYRPVVTPAGVLTWE